MFAQVIIEVLIVLTLSFLVVRSVFKWLDVGSEAKASPNPPKNSGPDDVVSSLRSKIKVLEAKRAELKELAKEVEISEELTDVEAKIVECKKNLASLECQRGVNS